VYILSSVLVVTERYWPDGGGGELATHLILDILRKRFDVTVVTGTKNPSKLPSVRYVYEPLLSKREKPILWLNTVRFVRIQRFQKLLRESDVVYIPRFAFPIISYAKKLGKKVVVHLHDYIPISYTATVLAPYEEHKHHITLDDIRLECMKSHKHCIGASLLWWLSKLARKWVSQADKIICVSRRQAEIIADQASEFRDEIEVVYNLLPPEIINAEPRKELDDIPTFLYVGGDSYVKGFHILLQALSKLGKQGVRARFVFTNKYSSRSLGMLKQLSDKYRNLEIQVLGRIEYSRLIELHRKAWALLFPSIWEEPLPYAVVEAMALGTIPIASKVGGVPELFDDAILGSFMFMPQNSSELIEVIKRLSMFSPNEMQSLSHKLRNIALKKFNVNDISRKIVQIFSSY
jgi:glycosyltransferase involved in cell wall biosynthesis